MPFALSEDARIWWRSQGCQAAPALVLLHSIGTDMTMHDEVAPILERDFHVLRIDLRGHGASDASPGEYSLQLLSRDVLAVLDRANIDRAIVCGTSLGAMVAMQLVQMAPDRVAGLALACTSALMSPTLWPERIATVRAQGLAPVLEGWVARHMSDAFMAAHPWRVETLEAAFRAMDPAGYIGCAAAIRDMDVLPGLPGVTAPTAIIAGTLDAATPFEGNGDRIAAATPGAAVTFLPAGHLACVEQPEAFAQCIRSLAARCT